MSIIAMIGVGGALLLVALMTVTPLLADLLDRLPTRTARRPRVARTVPFVKPTSSGDLIGVGGR